MMIIIMRVNYFSYNINNYVESCCGFNWKIGWSYFIGFSLDMKPSANSEDQTKFEMDEGKVGGWSNGG